MKGKLLLPRAKTPNIEIYTSISTNPAEPPPSAEFLGCKIWIFRYNLEMGWEIPIFATIRWWGGKNWNFPYNLVRVRNPNFHYHPVLGCKIRIFHYDLETAWKNSNYNLEMEWKFWIFCYNLVMGWKIRIITWRWGEKPELERGGGLRNPEFPATTWWWCKKTNFFFTTW